MTLAGIHHLSFTVTDLERTVAFYQGVVGMRLVGRKHRRAEDLGIALFGSTGAEGRETPGSGRPADAEILIADMQLGDTRVEFIQYLRPATVRYPGDPSVAGSAHLAILTDDIDAEYERLKSAGVEFHTPVRTLQDDGKPLWRWCYFRDPDGICVELVQSGAAGSDARGGAAAGGARDGAPPQLGAPPIEAGADATDREVARLKAGDYYLVERERSARRLDWLGRNGYPARSGDPLTAPVSPRKAYELLFLDYMGLTADQVPVVEESVDRIVWISSNDCPTLEACRRLGLDTREVCRATTERPVQTFLSRVDPRLRFVRDYVAIRPYAAHCREQIVRVDLEALMRQAIAEALTAKAEGNKGYGSLVVMGDRLLAVAHDTGTTAGDPSLHAEHTAIRRAVARWGSPDLTGALLVSTCEPCPMCTGLAVWAGVTTIIFGSSIADTAAMGRTRIQVGAADIAERSPAVLEVIGGLLREECDALYR